MISGWRAGSNWIGSTGHEGPKARGPFGAMETLGAQEMKQKAPVYVAYLRS